MKNFLKIQVVTLSILMCGCASSSQVTKLESSSETSQKLLLENERRLGQLEKSVASLNTQVAQLNNRVYEVRNSNGKKTSLVVAPIIAGSPLVPAREIPASSVQSTAATTTATANGTASAAQSVQQPASSNSRAQALLAAARKVAAERNKTAQKDVAGLSGTASASAPAGKMIDPSAAPTPLPAAVAQRTSSPEAAVQRPAGATGSMGRPIAGSSGMLSAQSTEVPAALPPIELPAQTQAQAASPPVAKGNQAVPVPSIPASALALPAEHPGLPPMEQSQTTPQKSASIYASGAIQTQSATQAKSSSPVTNTTSVRGEEAAYKNALNATLAGKTEEGLRLFRDFLQQYPNGRYAANADYWIGECLYAQGKYQEALAQFQNVNNAYPKHHKNADALLKAGMTMSRLGDKAAAAEKYRTLLAQFPNSDAANRARAMGVAR